MSDLPSYLEAHPDGVLVTVQARAGGSRNAITETQGDALKVMVTQVPEKGKANKVLCEVLARGLGLRKSQVELVSGETSPRKKFLVRGTTVDELALRLTSN